MSAPTQSLEIIGGGLAGLALGLALRRADVSVTLHEAGVYPRHRVCGEFIAGLAPATIARLGLAPFLDGARLHRTVAWHTRDRLLRTQTLPSPALGLSRHTLDARLAAAFAAAGGDLRTASRLTPLHPQPGRVFAAGRRPGKTAWLGLKIHARRLPLARDLELHLGGGAYVGLCGIENDGVNLCGLFRQRPGLAPAAAPPAPRSALLLDYLDACGLAVLAARLRAAEPDETSFCAVAALDFQTVAPAAAGRISLGDHYAMTPPFTGNGMAMAFQSAETALDPLLAYARGAISWNETCAEVSRRLARRFRRRLASAGWLHPFLYSARRQRWLSAASRIRLPPLRPLYHLIH
jgi:hypothetical protein